MMNESRIRPAIAVDVPAIAEIVDQAYRHYIARIGKPPGPMLDDYAARVSEGVVWVLEQGAEIAAIIVLLPAPNYLLLDNIAVSPTRQGVGLGRRLIAFAEDEALRRGYREIRLYSMKRWWRISASTARSVMKRRDAAARPATTVSSCASSFAINGFIKRPN
jgi:GNAT superfamily N-acetyltransferase